LRFLPVELRTALRLVKMKHDDKLGRFKSVQSSGFKGEIFQRLLFNFD
jgi:hypothetical protein